MAGSARVGLHLGVRRQWHGGEQRPGAAIPGENKGICREARWKQVKRSPYGCRPWGLGGLQG
ncbi:hypothetical protein J1614_007406 [Plenodomus biglobosus]|nr:hypothetical protein J1614_007406 [Plenodomus biglobosus]